MARNYTETVVIEKPDNILDITKSKILQLITEKVDNGSNIDYIVKLSEIYSNIK